jgi:hypothetical protein
VEVPRARGLWNGSNVERFFGGMEGGQFDEFFPFGEVAAIAADDFGFEVEDDGNGLRGFHR